MKQKYPYLISCDWLQVYCHLQVGFNFQEFKTSNYTIKRVPHGTKVWKDLYEIYENSNISNTGQKRLFLLIACTPYSSALNKQACVIKVENPYLYEYGYLQRLFHFITEIKASYKGITRLDLAYDCNKYYNGLKPDTLYWNYVYNKILKVGNSKKYSANLDQGYTLKKRTKKQKTGTIKTTYSHKGEFNRHTFQSVRWGNRGSGVVTTLYNKTIELKEVKDKPYIRNCWKELGMANDDKNPVWRLEISLQNRGKGLKDTVTGEYFDIGVSEIANQIQLENLFLTFAEKYADFAKREKQNKTEHITPIKLFCAEYDRCQLKPRQNRYESTPTQICKVVRNNIDKLINAIETEEFTPTDQQSVAVLKRASDIYADRYNDLTFIERKTAQTKVESKERKRYKRKLDTLFALLPDEPEEVLMSMIEHEENLELQALLDLENKYNDYGDEDNIVSR
jgi:hypothetical protein